MKAKDRITDTDLLTFTHCPGTLASGFETYSKTALNRVFHGKKVHHILEATEKHRLF